MHRFWQSTDPVLDDAGFGVEITLDFKVFLKRAIGDFDGKLDVPCLTHPASCS